MKPTKAILAWTPISVTSSLTCGQVMVDEWVSRTAPRWAWPYEKMGGAVKSARRSLTNAEAIEALRRDYITLVRDGIEPGMIDAAFAVIDGWQERK